MTDDMRGEMITISSQYVGKFKIKPFVFKEEQSAFIHYKFLTSC